MADREKVIKGLECIISAGNAGMRDDCANCIYPGGGDCVAPALRDALALLKAQEPRVMTIQEIKNADFCYLEVNGHDGVTPVLLKHFIDDKYIHVTINGGSVYFFDITCDVEKLVRCWTSRPTDEQREATPWN